MTQIFLPKEAVDSKNIPPTEPTHGTIEEARASVYTMIDGIEGQLRETNKHIHDNPELGYEEGIAHETLTGLLKSLGFAVTEHAYGLKTSFEAEIGSGGRLVVFCAEYDALPNIGHACGHNLIATSSIAAFIALAKTVTTGLAGFKLIASHKLRIEFTGRSSHAGAEPWNGVNALVAAYNNISMLRQQMRPDERIHGVIENGGTVPNVITEYARMNFNIRSPTMKRADELLLNYIYAPTYMDLRVNNTLCKYYVENMADLGEKILLRDDVPATASTDMGNVSYTVPSFHGGFAIPTPPEVTGYHPSFAKAAGTDEAHAAAIKCAKGMAMLGWRVLTDAKVAEGAKHDFKFDV